MKYRYIIRTLALVFTLATSSISFANMNAISVSFQLYNGYNQGIEGTYNLQFTIWDSKTGGSNLWSETQNGLVLSDGQGQAILGNNSGNPINKSQFIGKWQLWLQIKVVGGPNANSATLPRQPLRSVAYALGSERSNAVNRLEMALGNSFGTCNGNTQSKVWYNTAGGGKLEYCTGSQWRDIVSVPECSNNQVPEWNGSGWACNTDNNTTYSAGSGLTLSGTTFSVPTNGITGYHIANGTVAGADFKDNSINVGDKVANDVLTGGKFQNNSLKNNDVSSSAAIPISKLSNVAAAVHAHDSTYVNENQSASVTGTMISNGTLGHVDLAGDSVTAGKIKDGSIGAADINKNQVQRRISNACDDGTGGTTKKWLKGATADGTPKCETDGQGAKGVVGDKGSVGPKGPKGNTGNQGNQGTLGATGPKGGDGDKGDTGGSPKGGKGPKGDKGDQGAKGDTGNTGSKGDTGDTGNKGATGDSGAGSTCTARINYKNHCSCSSGTGQGATAGCNSGEKAVSGGADTQQGQAPTSSYMDGDGWYSKWFCRDGGCRWTNHYAWCCVK